MAVEDGKAFGSLVGQVMDQGDYNFQPSKMPNKFPKSTEEDPQIDPKLHYLCGGLGSKHRYCAFFWKPHNLCFCRGLGAKQLGSQTAIISAVLLEHEHSGGFAMCGVFHT